MLSIIPCTYLIFKCHLWSIITVKSSSHLKSLGCSHMTDFGKLLTCSELPLHHYIRSTHSTSGSTSRSSTTFFTQRYFLFDKGVANSDFLWFSCAWSTFCHIFTLSLCASFKLKWASCWQHRLGSWYLLFALFLIFNPSIHCVFYLENSFLLRVTTET